MSGGVVRGYDRHWRRFAEAALARGAGRAGLIAFRHAVTAALPREGDWFPRIELAAGGRAYGRDLLRLRLRPAPARVADVRAWVCPDPDPRRHPAVKGPDLPGLAVLRERARAAGADEAILLDPAGGVVEGASTSVLWWRDDVLWAVPDERAMPAVTRATLLAVAGRMRIAVAYAVPRPADLAGCETWLTNALHGIRPVTSWTLPGGRVQPGAPAPSAARWRTMLAAVGRPLDGGR